MQSYHTIRMHDGTVIDLAERSPGQVKMHVKQGCIAWRWGRIAQATPEISVPSDPYEIGACWGPLAKLTDPRFKPKDWGAEQRGTLVSILAGRQWLQERKFKAKLVDNPYCQLCLNLPKPSPPPRDIPVGACATLGMAG